MNGQTGGNDERGFTLIELLITIVVVGILTAVAIVGITGLQDNGSTSACKTTKDAAKAASAAYFANTGGTYPQTFPVLTNPASGQKVLDTSDSVIVGATTLKGKGWTLTLVPGATTYDTPTFTGC